VTQVEKEELYLQFFFFSLRSKETHFFLSIPLNKTQSLDFEKKNIRRLQIYKNFAEINFLGSRISKNFANKAKNRESFFLYSI